MVKYCAFCLTGPWADSMPKCPHCQGATWVPHGEWERLLAARGWTIRSVRVSK